MSIVIDFKSGQVVDKSLYRFFAEKQNNNKEIKKLGDEMQLCMLFDKPIAKKTIARLQCLKNTNETIDRILDNERF